MTDVRHDSSVCCLGIMLAAAWLTGSAAAAASDRAALATAERFVADAECPGGICVLAGRGNVPLAIALAKQGRFTVQCLVEDRQQVRAMRRQVREANLYGTVSVDALRAERLPYAGNLVNLLILDVEAARWDRVATSGEVARVLAPLGSVYVRGTGRGAERLQSTLAAQGWETSEFELPTGAWVRGRKPWPAEIDEWTHYLHGADGNPVARDHVVGPPQHYQWTAGPRWLRSHESDSSVSTLVTAGGRLFSVVDQAPASLLGPRGPRGQWFLEARDAFNGVFLWKVPIRRWGWREWKSSWFSSRPGDYPLNLRKRLVAVDEAVYVTLGYRAPVVQLDARTGRILRTYEATGDTAEILCHEGTLVLSVLGEDGPRVMAVDAESGATRWRTDRTYRGTTVDYLRWKAAAGGEPDRVDPALNIATDGDVVALIDGPHLVGLDFATGAERWRAEFPLTDEDQRAGGIATRGNLWNGTMIVCRGVVLHASPFKLAAFAADDGRLLWSQPKAYIGHLWYAWKDVFVIGELVWSWGAELERGTFNNQGRKQRTLWPRTVNGYQIRTGALSRQVEVGPIFKTHHHHRCYRNKATPRYILASRRGTEYVDLGGGTHTVHNWVRGTCHVGMMPANGLQYAPPHPCVCYDEEKLNGFTALAPGDEREVWPLSGPRLVRGPAFGSADAEEDPARIAAAEWPAFRHDAERTGAVRTRLPNPVKRRWAQPAGQRLSAPTVANGQVFVAAVDEQHVICLDAEDGRPQWEFATAGRVDSPPTYHRGHVLFGASDGRVYCLRAADGQLVWEFFAAPAQRWMGASSQLESAWPVHGSVLVRDDTAYFAAGRSSHLDGGIDLYALDAGTGAVRHHNRLQGPAYDSTNIEENFRLPMGTLPDVLLSEGDTLFMRGLALDATLRPVAGNPALRTGSGLLDGSYFKRTPWRFGSDYGRLLVHDKQSVYFVRMFDSLRGLDPTVYFTPGAEGYLLFARQQGQRQPGWRLRVPVRVRALALAEGQLAAAGIPDEVPAGDPWAAFEGRLGGRLLIVDTQTGEQQQAHELDSPPVFNGIAVANGRLYLTAQNGQVSCWGE